MAYTVTVTATTAGEDIGTFTIRQDNSSGTIVATNITRTQLVAGYDVSVANGTTSIYVESGGICDGTNKTVAITGVPVPVPSPTAPVPQPVPTASPVSPQPVPAPTVSPVPQPVPQPVAPQPIPVPQPTAPTPVSCYNCGDGAIQLNTSDTNYGQYPQNDVCSTSDASGTISWSSFDRPNRFNVRSGNSNIDYTTGWKGFANYSGPWGASLNTPINGTDSFTFSSTTNRNVQVEYGGADPSNPASDSAAWSIACASPTPVPQPVPAPTAPVPAPTSGCYAHQLLWSPSTTCEGSQSVYYGNSNNFCTSTQLFTNSFCTTLAPSGYYTTFGSQQYRFWNGTQFTANCVTCSIP